MSNPLTIFSIPDEEKPIKWPHFTEINAVTDLIKRNKLNYYDSVRFLTFFKQKIPDPEIDECINVIIRNIMFDINAFLDHLNALALLCWPILDPITKDCPALITDPNHLKNLLSVKQLSDHLTKAVKITRQTSQSFVDSAALLTKYLKIKAGAPMLLKAYKKNLLSPHSLYEALKELGIEDGDIAKEALGAKITSGHRETIELVQDLQLTEFIPELKSTIDTIQDNTPLLEQVFQILASFEGMSIKDDLLENVKNGNVRCSFVVDLIFKIDPKEPDFDEFIPVLSELIESGDETAINATIRIDSIFLLYPLKNALYKKLTRNHPNISCVFHAISHFKEKAAPLLFDMIEVIRATSTEMIKNFALDCIGNMGEKAQAAAPSIVQLCQDEKITLAQAADVLTDMICIPLQFKNLIREQIKIRNKKYDALGAIQEIGGESFIKELNVCLNSEDTNIHDLAHSIILKLKPTNELKKNLNYLKAMSKIANENEHIEKIQALLTALEKT
jgi:hypothetical protein